VRNMDEMPQRHEAFKAWLPDELGIGNETAEPAKS
jgi:hypothetical protein